MSAWIVSKGHIDVLVNGLLQHGLISPKEIAQTGQLLWRENHLSVNDRYAETTFGGADLAGLSLAFPL